MTAEVAVLNSIGVAVAADSAVTLTGPGANSKVYTSAEKIYQLANSAPVAIMTYGNASLIGVPWETIVKAFRKDLGTTSLSTLDQYVDKFFQFLISSSDMFTKDRQLVFLPTLVREHLLKLRIELGNSLDEYIGETGRITDKVVENAVYTCLCNINKKIKNNELLDAVSTNSISDICREIRPFVDQLTNEVFDQLAESVRVRYAIRVLVAESVRRKIGAGSKSGVVFTGFGDNEYFPRLVEFTVDEFLLGNLRYFPQRVQEVSETNSGAVVPFAQTSDVEAFMEGSDREIRSSIIGYQRDAFEQLAAGVGEQLSSIDPNAGRAIERIILSLVEDTIENIRDKWNQLSQAHWRPIIGTVAALPKDEMADMAENLVNLSRFRKRISTETETVAGPIDVAIITKGDGFVWVRRKHYFSPELNPRVIARLGR